VAIGDRDLGRAREVARDIAGAGGSAIALGCDVREPEEIALFVDAAAAEFGGIDGLDHNAAWTHPVLDTDALTTDLGVWDRVLNTNTRGALLLARHAIPKMIQRGGGAIVNISSGASTIGEATRVAYGVSKAAINQLTRHLAARFGREGIRANAIAPGFIRTESSTAGVSEAFQDQLAKQNPSGRLGEAADVAKVVAFLLSDASSYINGQLIHVDGGQQIAGIM
jgi:NAD(P)-dependent dehydrogenase (short-subunit alcohol dehydrogenase family)